MRIMLKEAFERLKMSIGISPSEKFVRSVKVVGDELANEFIKYQEIGTVEEFKMLKDHLWTLNKIANDYSAIGTVEEFKRAKEMEAVYGQVKWERDIAISQLEEIGVGLGQKMDEFKALKEKSVAKKVNIQQWIDTKCDCGYEFSKHHGDGYYSIPYEKQTKYCPECGQKLDFGEEE